MSDTPALHPTGHVLLCSLGLPGWGPTTLKQFTEGVAMRPEVDFDEGQCRQALDALVARGLVDHHPGDPDKWELNALGAAARSAPSPEVGTDPTEVVLELQPGIVASDTSAEGVPE